MKRYLEILKQHYEKLILSVVLLGLACAVGYLPVKIANDRQELRDMSDKILNRPVKELPALDSAMMDQALAETKERFEVSLSAPPHNTVNPVDWHRARPGSPLVRSAKNPIGVNRLEVTKVTPLYISLTWERTDDAGTSYSVRLDDQTVPPGVRRSQSKYLSVGQKLGSFTLKEVLAASNATPELVFEFTDNKETVKLAQGVAYRQVGGHTVDLKYDPEPPVKWSQQRVGAILKFARQEYTITAINVIAPNRYEVVVSAKQTGKKTTIPFNAVSQP